MKRNFFSHLEIHLNNQYQTLKWPHRKRQRVGNCFARLTVGNLHELLGPAIDNAFGRAISGQASQIQRSGILHVTVGEGSDYFATTGLRRRHGVD
ncbi:hypothetical protein [Methylobacter svalbardensis]|uniref:hypothetical protein n=1 Tax=Methylobacter svalbardensis TaxID=3080016 RepID=UPI0030EB17D0